VTDIGAAPENVVPAGAGVANYTGWIVPVGDAAELARRIAESLADGPANRAALGARARAHVAANFTLEAMQRATLAVYDELLGTDLARRFDASAQARERG
jgi:glycosyltransferase involved in cell wall biosynthesis